MTFGPVAQAADGGRGEAEPFKVANIHFETNASACDMGIQIGFDTDGVTSGWVRNPNGRRVYSFASADGMKATGGQTEGFLEGVEPQITELLEQPELECERSDEEGEISLEQLFRAWPAGEYTFKGRAKGGAFKDQAELTYQIPAGPVITAPVEPDNDEVSADDPLEITWDAVGEDAILPELGKVTIDGYHVVVVETGAEALPQIDVDLPADATSVTVPAEYLKPGTVYQFEVLASEESGNQTITEGFFCTVGVDPCEAP